jgi:DNA repair protein RadC
MGDYYRKYLVKVQLVRESKAKLDKVINAGSIVKIVSKHIEKYDREHLVVVYLDFGNNVVGIEEVSKGTAAGTSASPREIFKGALLSNAYAIILLHNLCVATHKLCYVQ